MADGTRKMLGIAPDSARALDTADLQGETATYSTGTILDFFARGYLIVTERTVRFYHVASSAPAYVMLATEIGAVTTDWDPPPQYLSAKGSVLTVTWITGEVKKTLRFIFPRGPLTGDPATAKAAADAIGHLAQHGAKLREATPPTRNE
jgi:hypothetical protein